MGRQAARLDIMAMVPVVRMLWYKTSVNSDELPTKGTIY